MSSEPNLPEVQEHQGPPPAETTQQGIPGTANSKNRRRRRKRKNRTAAAPGAENGSPVQAAPNGAVAEGAPRATNGSGQPQQANGGQQTQGAGKKWKKKYRKGGGSGDGQPRPEPGNSLYANGQGGRRGSGGRNKQRGPRSFVGPMDHSYREVNGNYNDGPPSTIEMHGNGNRGGHSNGHHRQINEDRLPPELLTNARAIPIPEDAPTHIYFFIEDLFFTAKIQESAKKQGVKVAFMKPDKDIVAQLADMEEREHPSLIVFDLNNANAKPLTLIPKLKSKLKKGTSIVGFLSHLQGDLKAKAVEAGCDTVMPRSAFSQNLPNLLRRYGVEEENEQNFNQ